MPELGGCGETNAVSGATTATKTFDNAKEFKPKRVRQKLREFSGEPYRIRTCDPLIKSQLLYQLS